MAEHGLTASYAMPYWRYHHLALGETMGFAARLNQNAPPTVARILSGTGTRGKFTSP
jgi:hypothetical protein